MTLSEIRRSAIEPASGIWTATRCRISSLVRQGFSEVYSLDSGFELWRATYPDETAQGPAE